MSRCARSRAQVFALVSMVCASLTAARCADDAGPLEGRSSSSVTLRVGVGGLPSQTPDRGVQQFVSNISQEGLLRVDHGGRPEAWLAESWKVSPDGLRLIIHLRSGARFQDGTPVNAAAVVNSLKAGLPRALRKISDDVTSIEADDDTQVSLRFRRPSTFVSESLPDVLIQKPGESAVGTGPFFKSSADSAAAVTMSAHPSFYLGTPNINRIELITYPNVRAAWADLLRAKVDMLYEMGNDALDLMRDAKTVGLYNFERPYQYLVILNTQREPLRSPDIRRALNQAINREALVHEGLSDQGTVSTGPLSAQHWAYPGRPATFTYAPDTSAQLLKRAHLRLREVFFRGRVARLTTRVVD